MDSQTDTQADMTENITYFHTRVVKIINRSNLLRTFIHNSSIVPWDVYVSVIGHVCLCVVRARVADPGEEEGVL